MGSLVRGKSPIRVPRGANRYLLGKFKTAKEAEGLDWLLCVPMKLTVILQGVAIK